MPCKCSKKRTGASKQMQRRILELDMLRITRSMKGTNPDSLTDRQLLDYHKKTHMLYAGNIKRNPVNKPFINSIVDLHDKFVEHMLNRGMKHNTHLKKV